MIRSQPSQSRRILILTLSFGSGHVRAAQAVAQELRRQDPDADVRVVDALADCRLLFRACYVWPYWLMIRYAPALWSGFFRARLKRMNRRTAPSWVFRWGCPQIFRLISDYKPHVVVAAEVAACELAALAKRSGLTQARIVGLVTDYEAEPAWVQREVEHYFVPDDEVCAQLQGWGARAAAISVEGIPVGAAFHRPVNTPSVRARYKLSADQPIVLLMGGGMGPTRMDRVAERLLRNGMCPFHLVAVTGHDKQMRRKLERLRATETVTLTVTGWCEDIASLMRTAEILVTKPGGLTTAEAAACRLPLVMFDPIPGPEQRNAQKIAATGAGIIAHSSDETSAAVLSLIHDERARRAMAVKARGLARPLAVSLIAADALASGGEKTNAPPQRRHASV